jgi:hypothetical protein
VSIALYFTKPVDTSIANKDSSFIEALERAAGTTPGARIVDAPALADVVVVDERYQYRTWHYADELYRNAFVREHASRICVINHDCYARVFLPGLYVSLERSRPSLVPAQPIPYKRDLWQIPVPNTFEFRPESLFTFRGAFHTHSIRKRLCRIMSGVDKGQCEELRKAFHSHDARDQSRYIDEIRGARFSLCPRGLSPSSYRLYESMQLGRCPVVISDDWIAPNGPDWERFAIFVPESKIDQLPAILAREADHSEVRGRSAWAAWNEYFSWPRRWCYFLEQILDFQASTTGRPGYKGLQEIWRSHAFRQRYNWTLTGRAKQLLARRFRLLVENPPPEESR